MTRRLLLACLLLTATPGVAQAATVRGDTVPPSFPGGAPSSLVTYAAAAGETNDLTWSFPSAHVVRLHDAGAPVSPQAGCVAVDAHTADCTAALSYASVTVSLGDGADRAAQAAGAGTSALNAISVDGGAGDDTLTGGTIYSTLTGGDGADTLRTGTAPGYFPGTADGGAGDDTLSGNGVLNGGAGNDRLTGGDGRGSQQGGTGDDVISGGGGTDDLGGGGGHDLLSGGEGNDWLSDGDGPGLPAPLSQNGPQPVDADVLDGGPGSDTVSYNGRSAPVTVDLTKTYAGQAGENDRISDVEGMSGGAGDDRLLGDAAPNTVYGGPGHDLISTRGNDDVVNGDFGDDIHLGSGDDRAVTYAGYPRDPRARRIPVDCGLGRDSVRYPDATHRVNRTCETVILRTTSPLSAAHTLRPRVACGPFRVTPRQPPCLYRLRIVRPHGDPRHGYRGGGTTLGATAWRRAPLNGRATLAIPRRFRDGRPVRLVLEHRRTTRSRIFTIGSYVTALRP